MRIRCTKPEFWRSADISALEDWGDRLLFMGLWSYVDDNGVGLDRVALIAADLFAGDLERDPSETFARVSRGLQQLSEAGLIERYSIRNDNYLSINTWTKHQRIDRPNKPRYPLPPSRQNEEIDNESETLSRVSRAKGASGTEEQRNRGTEERTRSSTPSKSRSITRAEIDKEFDDWWKHYPKKVARGQAEAAFRSARKLADLDTLVAGAQRYAKSVVGEPKQFIAYGSTWLNGKRWLDETDSIATPSAIESWLRGCWTNHDVASVTARSGLDFQTPDVPDDVTDVRVFTLQARRDWITEHHDAIVARIVDKESA